MKKKVLALALATIAVIGALTGCGSSSKKITVAVPNDIITSLRGEWPD